MTLNVRNVVKFIEHSADEKHPGKEAAVFILTVKFAKVI